MTKDEARKIVYALEDKAAALLARVPAADDRAHRLSESARAAEEDTNVSDSELDRMVRVANKGHGVVEGLTARAELITKAARLIEDAMLGR
jgi:hypothetical protein